MNTMNKLIIILLGVLLLGSMAYLTSCVPEDDDGYATCDGTVCDYSNPYSNQYSSSCYASKSDCETDTGNTCTDCS